MDDVIASFNRLRDPKVGSPAASLFKGIQDVKGLDASRVQFTLSDTNPEFASDVGDYHACIIPASSKDPGKDRIGSGPFMIDSYSPEDRIVLKKNPYFAAKDSQWPGASRTWMRSTSSSLLTRVARWRLFAAASSTTLPA